ncbi:MAG: hypothetical protein MUP55_02855, partial [Candidatus Aenigmarchaeota archaeon]|nr:hypothetical protein [Candidatus Aenigmarchaeota archaeon]
LETGLWSIDMTNYRRGYMIELKAKKQLENDGYYVTRSSGSHGIVDIFAVGESDIKAIQLKRSKSAERSYFSEISALRSLKFPSNVSKELWVWLDCERCWKKFHVI